MNLYKKRNKGLRNLFRKKGLIEKFYYKNKEFINYCIVSTVCTMILYFLYFLITWLTKGNYIFANLIAYITSFTILYIWDMKVFKSKPLRKKKRLYQLLMFIIFRIIGFAIDSFILIFLIEHFKMSHVIAKIMSSLITFMFNYITNKLFVFKERNFI